MSDDRFHNVRIHVPGPVLGKGSEVTLDGFPVKAITEVKVEAGVHEFTTVTITFLATVDITALAVKEVELPH